MKKALFLDRDGTLIKIIKRPNHPEKFTAPFAFDELEFAPHVHHLLEIAKEYGFLRIMITNQPDVSHGYLSAEEWQKIQDEVVKSLDLDDVFMCRHTDDDGCLLRKPSPLMILVAADKWGIDLRESYMIGDTYKDARAGSRAGCKTILVERECSATVKADFIVNDLQEIIGILCLSHLRQKYL
ncbi:MAG: HAD-IIIA family hydrolase [bacterium]|nr:HAD-IIIA family hydrolase [bacterium]